MWQQLVAYLHHYITSVKYGKTRVSAAPIMIIITWLTYSHQNPYRVIWFQGVHSLARSRFYQTNIDSQLDSSFEFEMKVMIYIKDPMENKVIWYNSLLAVRMNIQEKFLPSKFLTFSWQWQQLIIFPDICLTFCKVS